MGKRFFISAKKNQDRNGNTYHRVSVYDSKTGKKHTSPVTYGYGEQWQQTAREMMKKKGYKTLPSWKNSFMECRQVSRRELRK